MCMGCNAAVDVKVWGVVIASLFFILSGRGGGGYITGYIGDVEG